MRHAVERQPGLEEKVSVRCEIIAAEKKKTCPLANAIIS
jgi:hypothetical protein